MGQLYAIAQRPFNSRLIKLSFVFVGNLFVYFLLFLFYFSNLFSVEKVCVCTGFLYIYFY